MIVSGLYVRSEELDKRLLGTGPEARFLLEAVLRMAALGERWSGEKNDLVRRLRLTKNFVSVGVGDLECAGLLIRRSAVTKRRGRPAITYEMNGGILNDLNHFESPFSPLFDELFLGTEQPCGISQQTSERFWAGKKNDINFGKNLLSACNRLLLAVLLDHANEVGLVVGVSRSDLQRMTGFNAVRVRNRLAVLMECGWVQFHAPGFASTRFPGGKVKSSYVLDLLQLPHAQRLMKYEEVGFAETQFSRAEGMLVKGKTRNINFVVSRGAMLGIWLLLHRFVSSVLTNRKPHEEVEPEAVHKLIELTLKGDFPGSADWEGLGALCGDMVEWVVYLAKCYIDDHHIQGIDEGGQILILPFDEKKMRLVSLR